ncbi:hypothetical protein M3M35_07095 [Fructilactobacillus myrtifloralis]|uniref:ImmA/IrrE family metallo-endopeptidase n=1 Tax=Fructilactobacillus myrtifloralis TaxID=2940301 RepID=A0ABY5BN02_9LACO|nr:hypothetical protein [Fructilactobacillus myrtifloralis]USS85048.1 hypothetical protein M3M35_07095 [Fructilactobacillus myrtifloralis]
MTNIEILISRHPELVFKFERMPKGLYGLNIGNKIIINKSLSPQEQLQWLYEEIEHHRLSVGDISDYQDTRNLHQEYVARKSAMQKCIPKKLINRVLKIRPENDFEVADELGISIDYLHEVAKIYGFRFK